MHSDDDEIVDWDDEVEAAPELDTAQLGAMAQAGLEAFELTRHPAFVAAVDRLGTALFAQWAGTNLTEVDKREKIYAQFLGLQSIAGALAEQVSRGEEAGEVLASAQ